MGSGMLLPLADSDRRYLCALAWDETRPCGDQVRVFVPRVVMFGPRGGTQPVLPCERWFA